MSNSFVSTSQSVSLLHSDFELEQVTALEFSLFSSITLHTILRKAIIFPYAYRKNHNRLRTWPKQQLLK